jgi:hypothetical protein
MNIRFLYIIVSTLLFLGGCQSAQTQTPSPSDNSRLNTVSPSKNNKAGYLQRSYDTWEKEEWEPVTEQSTSKHASDKIETATTADKNASWGLQKYVDKWGHYIEEKQKEPSTPSQVEKLNAMPGIGKSR